MTSDMFVDYDQYYASLAASSSTTASAHATPSNLSLPGSSDFGDVGFDDEEDRKPTVEYLDSLNEYRKRSRSGEDEGVNGKTKVVKVDEGLNGYGYSPETGIVPVENHAVMVTDAQPPPSEDDPIVQGELFLSFHRWLILMLGVIHQSTVNRCRIRR